MAAILNKYIYLSIAIILLNIPSQGLAQHYLTSDLITSVKNPSKHIVAGWERGNKGEKLSSGCRIFYGFAEDRNLSSSATQFSWNAYDSTMNISFGHFEASTSYDASSSLFHTGYLGAKSSNLYHSIVEFIPALKTYKDKSTNVYHSIVAPKLLKNSFVSILNDDIYRDRDYTDLIFSDKDWLISTYTNYIVNTTIHLIVSTRFVVPENTPMEEIIELARLLDSHIKIEGL